MLIYIKEFLCYYFLYINYKKDFIMFKNILLSLALLTSIASTDEMVSENSHLKLKLEVYELKAQITELHKIIDELHMAQSQIYLDEQRRVSAIALLQSDLRESRRKKRDMNLLLEGS